MKVAELPQLAGRTVGPTEWSALSQDEVDRFADLTHDRNPVHVDPAFAARTPFGGTIAHGYFTVALLAPAARELLSVEDASLAINYGLDRLRFPSPLPVGKRFRTTGEVTSVDEIEGSGYQVSMTLTVDAEDGGKPVAVAEGLYRYYA